MIRPKRLVQMLVNRTGWQVSRLSSYVEIAKMHAMEPEFLEIYERCTAYTMLGFERMYDLYVATRYIVRHGVEGSFVQCGVWKGGSAMLIALTLDKMRTRRQMYLCDTYEGMAAPGPQDVDWTGRATLSKGDISSAMPDTMTNLLSTGYPEQYLHFVQGAVEDTIPAQTPDKIALLHLDTDFYSSTYHSLRFLYPKLSVSGVLAIDDYGGWRGAKQATDQYFEEQDLSLLMLKHGAGRIALKV